MAPLEWRDVCEQTLKGEEEEEEEEKEQKIRNEIRVHTMH